MELFYGRWTEQQSRQYNERDMRNSRSTYLLLILILFLCLSDIKASRAATESAAPDYKNLGFSKDNIWYSKDPFGEGDRIRVYSAVYNSSPDTLLGTIRFYNNDELIGEKEFSLAGEGRIRDVWVEWQATAGYHRISAEIHNARISKLGQSPREISVTDRLTGQSERYVAAKEPPKPPPSSSSQFAGSADSSASSQDKPSGSSANTPGELPLKIASFIPENMRAVIGQVAGAFDQAIDQAADYLEAERKFAIERLAELEEEGRAASRGTGSADNASPEELDELKTQSGAERMSLAKRSSGSYLSRLWHQAYAALLAGMIYLLRTAWLLYLVLILIVLWILRIIWRKVRGE